MPRQPTHPPLLPSPTPSPNSPTPLSPIPFTTPTNHDTSTGLGLQNGHATVIIEDEREEDMNDDGEEDDILNTTDEGEFLSPDGDDLESSHTSKKSGTKSANQRRTGLKRRQERASQNQYQKYLTLGGMVLVLVALIVIITQPNHITQYFSSRGTSSTTSGTTSVELTPSSEAEAPDSTPPAKVEHTPPTQVVLPLTDVPTIVHHEPDPVSSLAASMAAALLVNMSVPHCTHSTALNAFIKNDVYMIQPVHVDLGEHLTMCKLTEAFSHIEQESQEKKEGLVEAEAPKNVEAPPPCPTPATASPAKPIGFSLSKVQALTPETPASEFPLLSQSEEQWLLRRWRTEWGDQGDREGISWEFWPPFPFQRFSQIPESLEVLELHELTFMIHGRTIFHQPVTQGQDIWSVVASGAEDANRDIRFRMMPIDLGNGSYLVKSPVPSIPGRYIIAVGLVMIDATMERNAVDWQELWCRYNEGCHGDHKPNWPGWTEELHNTGRNNVVLISGNKNRNIQLTIKPMDLNNPEHVKTAITKPFGERPVCKDTEDRPGYNVGPWFFRYDCNYRWDKAFQQSCSNRLASKRVMVIGASLETRMVNAALGNGEAANGQLHFRRSYGPNDDWTGDVQITLEEEMVQHEWDYIVYEMIFHEALPGRIKFLGETLPIIEHYVDEYYLRPRGADEKLINKTNPHYKPGTPVPPLKVKNMIFMSASYVQWNLMQFPWRFAEVFTNSYNMEVLGKYMYDFVKSRAPHIPWIGRFWPMAARFDDTADNVHYGGQIDLMQWRLVLNQICLDEVDKFESEGDRYNTNLYHPSPIGSAGR